MSEAEPPPDPPRPRGFVWEYTVAIFLTVMVILGVQWYSDYRDEHRVWAEIYGTVQSVTTDPNSRFSFTLQWQGGIRTFTEGDCHFGNDYWRQLVHVGDRMNVLDVGDDPYVCPLEIDNATGGQEIDESPLPPS